MKYYLLSIIIFISSFTTCVYAGEVESTETTTDYYEDSLWHKGLSSLQDAFDSFPRALQELRDTAESFGVAADATVQTLVNAPVKAVMSNFLACSEDMIDECTNLLTSSRDFMSSIFINPIDKTFLWNDETAKIGHDILKDRFLVHYEENVPRGFHKADGSSFWIDGSWVYCFVCNKSDAYFTRLTNGQILMCTVSGQSSSWQKHANSGTVINNPDKATNNFDFSTRTGVVLDKSIYYYFCSNRQLFTYGEPSDFSNKFPPVYSSINSALEAFYGFVPSSGTRPNGKGYFRPLPKNTIVKASGNNVYNNNWGDIIVNNYTTYGDTFENTVYNNYYYSSTNKDTPVYWYDIYSNPISISQGTYDDITNVTLGDPNISANNSFFTSIFNALPVALSTMIISLLILSIVILFLKG